MCSPFPSHRAVGTALDESDAAARELRARRPNEFARRLRGARDQDADELVRKLVSAVDPADSPPDMAALHEAIVVNGLLEGMLAGALNYLVETVPASFAGTSGSDRASGEGRRLRPLEDPPPQSVPIGAVLDDTDAQAAELYASDPWVVRDAVAEYRRFTVGDVAAVLADGTPPPELEIPPEMRERHVTMAALGFTVGVLAGALQHAAIPLSLAA